MNIYDFEVLDFHHFAELRQSVTSYGRVIPFPAIRFPSIEEAEAAGQEWQARNEAAESARRRNLWWLRAEAAARGD